MKKTLITIIITLILLISTSTAVLYDQEINISIDHNALNNGYHGTSAGGTHYKLAQQFVINSSGIAQIYKVGIYVDQHDGANYDVNVSLVNDNGSNYPDESVYLVTNWTVDTTASNPTVVYFNGIADVIPGNTYWILMTPNDHDAINNQFKQTYSTGGTNYQGGIMARKEGATWTTYAAQDARMTIYYDDHEDATQTFIASNQYSNEILKWNLTTTLGDFFSTTNGTIVTNYTYNLSHTINFTARTANHTDYSDTNFIIDLVQENITMQSNELQYLTLNIMNAANTSLLPDITIEVNGTNYTSNPYKENISYYSQNGTDTYALPIKIWDNSLFHQPLETTLNISTTYCEKCGNKLQKIKTINQKKVN